MRILMGLQYKILGICSINLQMIWIYSTISNEKSIKEILEELEKFRLQSGFTVSYDKDYII